MLSKIPIIREILRSTPNARKSASRETLFSVGFSTLPIWFLPLLFGFFTQEKVFGLLKKVVSTGELYIISSAMVGPMICWILADYIIDTNNDNDNGSASDSNGNEDDWPTERISEEDKFLSRLRQKFPDAISLISLLFLVALVSVFAVFLERSDEVQPWAFSLDDTALMICGILIFILSIFLLYSVLCFRYDLQNATGIMRDKTHSFVDDFKNFKGST